MNNKTSTVIELDTDHEVWNNELNDMLDEIREMEARMAETLFSKKQVEKEYFQNQFSIHKNAMEGIKNRMQKCELHSEITAGSCFESVDQNKYEYHHTWLHIPHYQNFLPNYRLIKR